MRGMVTRDWIGVALGAIGAFGAVLLVFSPRVQDTTGRYRAPYCGAATLSAGARVPGGDAAAEAAATGWLSDLRYVGRYPGPTLTLGAHRVAVEVAHVRPYYSIVTTC